MSFPESTQTQEADDHNISPKPPTFEGRLKLSDFMFNSSDNVSLPASPRRSPRLNLTPSVSGTPKEASLPPSPSPLKRSKSEASVSSPSRASSSTVPASSKRKAPSSTPSPRKRQSSSYAPPSTYAHMPLISDAMAPNLLVLFVGLNPGLRTSLEGHAYAHPTNLFWRLLFSSGVTPRLVPPTEDKQMPALYSLGLTNIVARPTKNGAELSKQEMDDGVSILEAKIRDNRPEVVCIVGKSIWESVWRVKHGGRPIKKEQFRYGWQVGEEEYMGGGKGGGTGWKGARVFVATSTSGLAATLKPAEKEAIWRELGDWVVKRRKERSEEQEKEKAVAADGGHGAVPSGTEADEEVA